MTGLNDVLEVIIKASLWADERMLRSWPLVNWAAYRAADRVWPAVIRGCVYSSSWVDIETFERYLKDRRLIHTRVLNERCMMVSYPLLLITIQSYVVDRAAVARMTGTYYMTIISDGASVLFIIADGAAPVMTRGSGSPLARAVMRVFPELAGR